MRIDPAGQLVTAAAAMLLGAAAGVLYDLLRALRRRADSETLTFVTDIIFSAAAGLGLFLLGFASGGEQRVFMAVLAAVGMVLYLSFPSIYVLRFFSAVLGVFAHIMRVLLFPIALCCTKLKKLIIFAKKSFEIRRRQYIIERDVVCAAKRRRRKRRKLPEGNTNETQTGRYYY